VDADGPEQGWAAHLDDPAVRAAIAEAAIVRALQPVGEVSSTQDVALGLAARGMPGGTVIIAEQQSAGRGRSGRRWDDDAAGGTLALTLLLDVPADVPAGAAPLVPLALGLAVAVAVDALAHANVRSDATQDLPSARLKWPNDVIVRDGRTASPRKLAGVLVEREQVGGRDVLLGGIGLNVDLRMTSAHTERVSLAECTDGAVRRAAVIARLWTAIDEQLVTLRRSGEDLMVRYRARCETIGRAVDVALPGGNHLTGTAIDVDAGGRLLVRTLTGVETVFAGTVRDRAGDEPAAGTP